jgi:hypothetical protein
MPFSALFIGGRCVFVHKSFQIVLGKPPQVPNLKWQIFFILETLPVLRNRIIFRMEQICQQNLNERPIFIKIRIVVK